MNDSIIAHKLLKQLEAFLGRRKLYNQAETLYHRVIRVEKGYKGKNGVRPLTSPGGGRP